MNRLILLVESRIRGDVYVRFGGELPKTHRSNTAGRWMLSLPLKSVNNLVKDARKMQEGQGPRQGLQIGAREAGRAEQYFNIAFDHIARQAVPQ